MFDAPDRIHNLVRDRTADITALVIGDVMLDRYLWGEVSRISPEAPVPVVRVARRGANPGGAANVAANLAALGCRVRLAGITGDDEARNDLLVLLRMAGIDHAALIADATLPTIVKTRIIGGHQQMLRLDEERSAAPGDKAAAELDRHLFEALDGVQVVILSDYAKGVVTVERSQRLIAAARIRGIPLLVDPKGTDWAKYAGATTVTPNTGELALMARCPASDFAGLVTAGRRIQGDLGLGFLTFTRGEHGITLIDEERDLTVSALAREVFDVSGAGDTVIATMAVALAGGIAPGDAMRLANLAASVVVAKVGTVPITRDELQGAVALALGEHVTPKTCDWPAAAAQVRAWRAHGETVVFTNGCFDVLHAGHVTLLEKARALGDRLVVGLNADASVRRLKGPTRPVNTEQDRARVLAALAAVDLVVLFDQDTPLEAIRALRPDVLVKGADYQEDQVVGGLDVKSWGGRVALIPLVEGRSTTGTIARLGGAPP